MLSIATATNHRIPRVFMVAPPCLTSVQLFSDRISEFLRSNPNDKNGERTGGFSNIKSLHLYLPKLMLGRNGQNVYSDGGDI